MLLSISPSTSLRLKNPNPCTFQCQSSPQQTAAKSAIQRICEKLRTLGHIPPNPSPPIFSPPQTGPKSAGEIFIPTPLEIPIRRVGHTIDSSWSTPEHPVPVPGSGDTMVRFRQLRQRERSAAADEGMKAPTVAELTMDRKELKRVRTLGIGLRKGIKVGKAGITEGIVNGIHERWRRSEVVKIRCEDLCRMNMKRTHEILERKTGGLVVWRSGNIVVLYRGEKYEYPYFYSGEDKSEKLDEDCSRPIENGAADKEHSTSSSSTSAANSFIESSGSRVCSPFISGVGSPNKLRLQLPGEAQLEDEADRLLDGLGPRFTDWWGYDPLPVDGDLLPAIVPGFRKPFRLLPFGVKPQLTDRESTILRRLSRHIPCHFALGRNRNLQGLAVSIIKLWEKCEVAKIAIKRSAQNTDSGIMAEELKKLTGGTLLSRDKDFIVLYRGKDFLPPAVSIAIEERRNWNSRDGKPNKDQVSPLMMKFSSNVRFTNSFSETEVKEKDEKKIAKNLKSAWSSMRKVETKLNQVNQNIQKTEEHLEELESLIEPTAIESDKEGISKEERYMLRRVGLRMKPFLLLGRRGVFDGTIENMHLHWKYRELVKIIFNGQFFENVESIARTLEAESGGILVAVERVSKGHAVVIYRGKNYRRPASLRPKTLLSKKEALKRYVEAQRYESLKLHALGLSKTIDQLDYKNVSTDLKMNMLLSSDFEEPNSSNDVNDKIGSLRIENDNGYESEIESNISFQSDFNGENVKEVNEVNAESFQPNDYGNIPSNKMETFIVSNQNMLALEHQNEDHDAETAEHCLVPIRNISISGSDEKSLDPELNQDSRSTICDDSGAFACGGAQSLLGLSSLESCCERESDVESIFRPAPLSNRERLLLRKQALKMKKRPVLAVGRNNILTGVAKTIKTHFRKHPLAIVNIKGSAKGTSVQELIFELEQVTGSVLVSREPNKVILYRGWGEGDVPRGIKRNDVNKVPMEVNEGQVSHQLIEAIRRECGLSAEEQ